MSLHHNYSFALTVAWGENQKSVVYTSWEGAEDNFGPSSLYLVFIKYKGAYQKYLSASRRQGKAIPYSFLFRKALPFS